MFQTTRNQHTTPACYLKNFSGDKSFIHRKFKKVFTTEEALAKEIHQPAAISKATVVKDFYTVKQGNEPMLIETLIYAQVIEQAYPKIYNFLVDIDCKDFTMEQRSQLLMFFMSLHCRTPKQFKFFSEQIPSDFLPEKDKIMEDYKAAHVSEVLPNIIAAHEFKKIKVARIRDTSEFLTCDNPVLIIGEDGELKNHIYTEQFNPKNRIIVPIDNKRCLIFTHCLDKNGSDAHGKLFYNRIERVEVDCSFTQNVNYKILESADKFYFGSENQVKAYFSLFKLVDKIEDTEM